MRALAEAAEIAEAAACSFHKSMPHRRSTDIVGAARDRAAANACESVAYLIRERMQETQS
jgi:hypothetical protein